MKEQNYYFDFKSELAIARLAEVPSQSVTNTNFTVEKRNMHNSIRILNERCKIKHVKNLLPRIANSSYIN